MTFLASRSRRKDKGGESMYSQFKRLLYFPLFIAIWIMSPITAYADPIISGLPLISLGLEDGQVCPTCIPISNLAFSSSLTSSFASAVTTAGGMATVSAPILTTTATGAALSATGSITTIGPGSASLHFGDTARVDITNTSTN